MGVVVRRGVFLQQQRDRFGGVEGTAEDNRIGAGAGRLNAHATPGIAAGGNIGHADVGGIQDLHAEAADRVIDLDITEAGRADGVEVDAGLAGVYHLDVVQRDVADVGDLEAIAGA